MNKSSRLTTFFVLAASYMFGQITIPQAPQDLTPEPQQLKFILKTPNDPGLGFFLVQDEEGKDIGAGGVNCIEGQKFARYKFLNPEDNTSTKVTAFPLQKPAKGPHGGFLRTEAQITLTLPLHSVEPWVTTDRTAAEKEVRQDIDTLRQLNLGEDPNVKVDESSLISGSCNAGKANLESVANNFRFLRDRASDNNSVSPVAPDADDDGFRVRPIPLAAVDSLPSVTLVRGKIRAPSGKSATTAGPPI